jgi:hypothetical protein
LNRIAEALGLGTLTGSATVAATSFISGVTTFMGFLPPDVIGKFATFCAAMLSAAMFQYWRNKKFIETRQALIDFEHKKVELEKAKIELEMAILAAEHRRRAEDE